ncbi:MAG: Gfo/Idh/MocA family oxidoreductase [Planctomycetota bacterium]
MPQRVAIVGSGMIANFHARAIQDAEDCELAGVHSRRPEATQEFASKYDAKPYETLDSLLNDTDVNVVSVCTPSGAHLDPAVAAARAGKHVVVEKPLEVTTERCDQIIDACENAGVRLSVTFQSRFHESSRLLKQAVDAKRFGRVTMGSAYVKWYRSQEYYDSGAWRGTWKLDGGGALMNQAIHSVDLLLWLMGDVKRVSAMTAMMAHERIEVEDVAVATIEFTSGALGIIEASTATYPGTFKRIEVSGFSGSATLEEEGITQWAFEESHPDDEEILARMSDANETGGGAADPASIGHHGHAKLFEEVACSIREDRPSLLDGHEGRRSVELIEAVYKSAKSGSWIEIG